jgi:stage II sporulation protein AA (anti-sigma F factor antagonist)
LQKRPEDIKEEDTTEEGFFVVSFCFIGKRGLEHMVEPGFSYEARGQVLVIHLPKELDHHNCRSLRYETDLLLAENYVTKIVFDFSKTVFMDSSGIGVLLNRYKQMERSGGKVSLYGAGAQILRVLAIGGVGKLVPQYDSKEAAIADAL